MLNCYFDDNEQSSLLRHAVVDALIIDGTKILLVKRAKVLVHPEKWALPGGFVEKNETLIQAAQREAEEETGYKIKISGLFRFIDQPHRRQEESENVAFEFLGKAIKKITHPDNEISEVKWFDLNNLPPQSEIAFDHLETIKLFCQTLFKIK